MDAHVLKAWERNAVSSFVRRSLAGGPFDGNVHTPWRDLRDTKTRVPQYNEKGKTDNCFMTPVL
jgi:hypothetical protein